MLTDANNKHIAEFIPSCNAPIVGTNPTDVHESNDFLMDLMDWIVGCTIGLTWLAFVDIVLACTVSFEKARLYNNILKVVLIDCR